MMNSPLRGAKAVAVVYDPSSIVEALKNRSWTAPTMASKNGRMIIAEGCSALHQSDDFFDAMVLSTSSYV
jgi:hypothetical protein